jgi:hypothetical protein
MSYSSLEFVWVIGFAISTVLAVAIFFYRRHRQHSLMKQAERLYIDREFIKHQIEIEKWKREVFRP